MRKLKKQLRKIKKDCKFDLKSLAGCYNIKNREKIKTQLRLLINKPQELYLKMNKRYFFDII